jgi:hypothetical protein
MAGSSNFLQWNPSQTNQETDSEYSADTLRSSGAIGGVFPATTGNKVFYQTSIMTAALAGALALKGYTVSDNNFSTLEAVLGNIITNADQKTLLTSATYSATPTFDLSTSNGYAMTLGGSITPTITGASAGQIITFVFTQDTTGSRTVTWPSNVIGGTQPSPAASSVSTITFICDNNSYLRATAPSTSSTGINGTPIGQSSSSVGAFTTLTANTPATSDSSTNAATTAWVNAFLLAAGQYLAATPGYVVLPSWLGGITINWGIASGVPHSGYAVTFAQSFSSSCFGVLALDNSTVSANTVPNILGADSITRYGATLKTTSSAGSGTRAFWLAIGA